MVALSGYGNFPDPIRSFHYYGCENCSSEEPSTAGLLIIKKFVEQLLKLITNIN